jgi:orotate phosphoribosyltransferase
MNEADALRQQLLELLRSRSLQTGDFVLSSGARSTYYIDARATTMSGDGQRLIGAVALDAIDRLGWQPRCVGGLTLGADPVAYAIAHTAALRGRAIDAFTVRKDTKRHGTARRIEGAFTPGAPVVVVEDVITTGESALTAARVVQEAGSSVLGILALVDREEGGRDRIAAEGYSVAALFTAGEIRDYSSNRNGMTRQK